jgi:hypothetical protein
MYLNARVSRGRGSGSRSQDADNKLLDGAARCSREDNMMSCPPESGEQLTETVIRSVARDYLLSRQRRLHGSASPS